MDPIATKFDASRAGSAANEALFPSPEKGQPNLKAFISQQQLTLDREFCGDVLNGTMAISYTIVDLNYTATAILQTREDKAAVAVQLICQVDGDGVPITTRRLDELSRGTRAAKQKLINSPRSPRQWCVVEAVELTESPTYNYLTDRIRQALPMLYAAMVERPDGGDNPLDLMRKTLQIEVEIEEEVEA
jgi:hypothetical protein